jgi:hypothetical protein
MNSIIQNIFTATLLSTSRLLLLLIKVVGILRDRCGLDLFLCLVEKHESGSASGGYGCYDRYSHRKRGRCYGYYDEDEYDDHDDDDGEDATMEEVFDSSVDVKRWVGVDGTEVATAVPLDLDEGSEELLGEEGDLFEDLEPHRREYEGYTGNAGPSLEQWLALSIRGFS